MSTDRQEFLKISHLYLHHPDDLDVEVLQVLLVLQVKVVPAGVQRHAQFLWPVFVTFDPPPFYFLGHHCDDLRLVFPDHLPEGWDRGRQRALAGDVEKFLAANVHADVAGVDVILVVSDGNTSFVIYKGEEKHLSKVSEFILEKNAPPTFGPSANQMVDIHFVF